MAWNWDVDAWFPNFTLFVLYLVPIVLAIIFIMFLVYRYATRERMTFAEMLNYIPVLYLFFVFYEIGEYLYGTRQTIADRLFDVHLENMMYIIVLVGIAQVLYFFITERRSVS